MLPVDCLFSSGNAGTSPIFRLDFTTAPHKETENFADLSLLQAACICCRTVLAPDGGLLLLARVGVRQRLKSLPLF